MVVPFCRQSQPFSQSTHLPSSSPYWSTSGLDRLVKFGNNVVENPVIRPSFHACTANTSELVLVGHCCTLFTHFETQLAVEWCLTHFVCVPECKKYARGSDCDRAFSAGLGALPRHAVGRALRTVRRRLKRVGSCKPNAREEKLG